MSLFQSPPWTQSPLKTPICNVPWRGTSVVLSDGRVNFCCFSDAVVGNVKEKTFEEIWNGPEMQEIRSELTEGRIPPACAKPSCPIFRGDEKTHLWEKMRGVYHSEDERTVKALAELRSSFSQSSASMQGAQVQVILKAQGVRKPVHLYIGQKINDQFIFGPEGQKFPRPVARFEMNESASTAMVDISKLSSKEKIFVAIFDVDSNPSVSTNCFWMAQV